MKIQELFEQSLQRVAKATIEAVEEWLGHSELCILNWYEAGRPTKDGGYEHKYRGKWYQAKPIDETPKCNCGLSEKLKNL